jgi:hypothetical protein
MTRSIVEQAVMSQNDLRLADCECTDLDAAVTRCGADVLIVEESADRSEAFYRRLFVTHPFLKICILTQGGRSVTLMRIRRVLVPDTSAARLIEAIRYELQAEAMSGDEGEG